MKEVKDILKDHLASAWKSRKSYIETQQIEAFRLATQEELEMPVAVDKYLDVGVLQVYDEQIDRQALEELKKLLTEEFGMQVFFEKRRYRVKDTPEAGGDLREPPVERIVTEYGHKFLVNLNNYLDTGLFLDHRETRQMVEKMVSDFRMAEGRGMQMLNLFAYTGSFSVYSAAGEAEMTHTVDLSKTYCDWARRNLDLNGFPADRNWVYRMDNFEFYKYAARKKLSFDLIVIDPPTFSRNKEANFSVQRDQLKLIEGAASLLRHDSKTGGKIIFSNNCLDFQLSPEISRKFKVQNIQNETIPKDFWLDTMHEDWGQAKNQIHNCFLLEQA